MKINYMGRTITCDSCTETDGKLTLYEGGVPIMTIANIPDLSKVLPEDGIIEHILTPLEEALEDVSDLQADLAQAAETIQGWRDSYMEVLADDEAKRARLERIEALVTDLGEGLTLTKLIKFVTDLKTIIEENL